MAASGQRRLRLRHLLLLGLASLAFCPELRSQEVVSGRNFAIHAPSLDAGGGQIAGEAFATSGVLGGLGRIWIVERPAWQIQLVEPPDPATGGALLRVTLEEDGSLSLLGLGIPGSRYELEVASTLEPPDWQPVQEILADAHGRVLFPKLAAAEATRFFRLRRL